MPRKYKRKPGVVPRRAMSSSGQTDDTLALAFGVLDETKKESTKYSQFMAYTYSRTSRRRHERKK